jgi:hypothetical protein
VRRRSKVAIIFTGTWIHEERLAWSLKCSTYFELLLPVEVECGQAADDSRYQGKELALYAKASEPGSF